MKAEEIHVSKLFHSGYQFIIPLWQRHYSWDATHWTELWNDLLRVANEHQAEHFVGSIVLQVMAGDDLPSESRRYWVVDGQQRITTFTILICALRDRLASIEGGPEASQETSIRLTSQLLINNDLDPDHQRRLVLQERDQESLERIVDRRRTGKGSTNVDKAYDFFESKLENLERTELTALMLTMRTKFTAVWITLQEQDNSHRVFQTLNAGGKKLEQTDLIRNYFFLLLGKQGDAFYKSHWRAMEEALIGGQLEEFFVAWTITQGHKGKRSSLFSYFQADLRQYEFSPSDVNAYGTKLVEVAKLYRLMKMPAHTRYGAKLKRTLEDLSKWKATPVEGIMLTLIRAEDEGRLTETELWSGLEILISFMARRQLAGYEPNRHRSIFLGVTERLWRHQLSHGDLIDYLHYTLSEGDESAWPSDHEIEANSVTVKAYTTSRSRWAFVILERIERSLYEHSKHAQDRLEPKKYSIEHILPQTLPESWKGDLERWGEDPYEIFETQLHTLGNLTLTPINSELGNMGFSLKARKLADDSLRLNQMIAGFDQWTGTEISSRSKRLAARACTQFVAPLRAEALQDARNRFSDLRSRPHDFDAVDEPAPEAELDLDEFDD